MYSVDRDNRERDRDAASAASEDTQLAAAIFWIPDSVRTTAREILFGSYGASERASEQGASERADRLGPTEQAARERTSKPTDGEVDAHDRLDSA